MTDMQKGQFGCLLHPSLRGSACTNPGYCAAYSSKAIQMLLFSLVNSCRSLHNPPGILLLTCTTCWSPVLQFDDICEAVRISRSVKNPYRTILRRRYRPQLVISLLVPIFQQLTGINAIM